jgi:uncharacterized circularly permuted ATP-grasp superfamily protein
VVKRKLFHLIQSLTLSASLGLILSGALWADELFYNEIFDNHGNLRPAYADIYPVYESLGSKRQDQFLVDSKKDFRGDNAMDAMPRALTWDEYSELKKGVEQRARALQLFLKSYYSGNWADVERVIPRPVLERIVSRTHESPYLGLISPDSIAFPYGPDIIRDLAGQWRVVEDNPGYIGGPGDLLHARKIIFDRIPEYKGKISPIDTPEKFYDELVERYRSLRKPPGGRVVFFLTPPYPDHEDDRLKKIFSDRGVEVVTPLTKKKLVVNNRGAFLEFKNSNGTIVRERVGYLALNGEHAMFDPKHAAVRERALVDEAQVLLSEHALGVGKGRAAIVQALTPDPVTGRVDLDQLESAIVGSGFETWIGDKSKQTPGLVEAILKGKVASNYSPGVDFIGDKEFYIYVDDMVRHYLGEEPVLKNIQTERFGELGVDGKMVVRKDVLDRIFSDPHRYVIKAVDGRGGDAVWVGSKTTPEILEQVRKKIISDPGRFISQKFTHLPVMNKNITDLRMIAAVDQAGVFVSPTPWGRALPMDGDGKVNLSSAGREVAIMVVHVPTAQKMCIERSLVETIGLH